MTRAALRINFSIQNELKCKSLSSLPIFLLNIHIKTVNTQHILEYFDTFIATEMFSFSLHVIRLHPACCSEHVYLSYDLCNILLKQNKHFIPNVISKFSNLNEIQLSEMSNSWNKCISLYKTATQLCLFSIESDSQINEEVNSKIKIMFHFPSFSIKF